MMRKVLLVSSGGGHAVQAQLLRPAFEGHEVVHRIAGDGRSGLIDCSLSTIWRVPFCMRGAVGLLRREAPDTVISTGALPGLIAILVSRVFGVQTVWIDSVANARKLSLSGKVARLIADRTYSQWPDVARREAVTYAGAVL